MPAARTGGRAMAAVAVLATAGCGPLVKIGDAPPPPAVLFALRAAPDGPAATLPPEIVGTPATPGAAGAAGAEAAAARTIVVELPMPAAALRTVRVPVATGDTRIAYLKDALWLEPPARQLQRLLLDHVARQPGVVALDPRLYDGPVERRLGGTLADFGLDVRVAGRPLATLRFDAVLTGARGALVATRRFEVTRPAASSQPRDVTEALNAIANEAAALVAAWAAGAPSPASAGP